MVSSSSCKWTNILLSFLKKRRDKAVKLSDDAYDLSNIYVVLIRNLDAAINQQKRTGEAVVWWWFFASKSCDMAVDFDWLMFALHLTADWVDWKGILCSFVWDMTKEIQRKHCFACQRTLGVDQGKSDAIAGSHAKHVQQVYDREIKTERNIFSKEYLAKTHILYFAKLKKLTLIHIRNHIIITDQVVLPPESLINYCTQWIKRKNNIIGQTQTTFTCHFCFH